MPRASLIFALSLAAALAAGRAAPAPEKPPATPAKAPETAVFLKDSDPIPLPQGMRILFSPDDDIESYIAKLLSSAKTEILVNQYAISSPKIVNALIQAFNERKVVVSILLDPEPNLRGYQGITVLTNNNLPVRVVRANSGFNNSRYCLLDRTAVLLGSPDWTSVGLRSNAESLMAIAEPSVVNFYYRHFLRQLEKSKEPFAPSNR